PSIDFTASLASQAGLALENALLHAEVRTLFDGFVRASVTAIESRDPTTSGHSERVATLTVALARTVDDLADGPCAAIRFGADALKELEYAALLHDFGKVGVREHVLVKANKLYEHERAILDARFDFIRTRVELERSEAKVRALVELPRDEAVAELAAVDRLAVERLRELDDIIAFVDRANQPTVLEQGGLERVEEIARRMFRGL